MPAKTKSTAKDSTATIGFEAKLWLPADKLRLNGVLSTDCALCGFSRTSHA